MRAGATFLILIAWMVSQWAVRGDSEQSSSSSLSESESETEEQTKDGGDASQITLSPGSYLLKILRGKLPNVDFHLQPDLASSPAYLSHVEFDADSSPSVTHSVRKIKPGMVIDTVNPKSYSLSFTQTTLPPDDDDGLGPFNAPNEMLEALPVFRGNASVIINITSLVLDSPKKKVRQRRPLSERSSRILAAGISRTRHIKFFGRIPRALDGPRTKRKLNLHTIKESPPVSSSAVATFRNLPANILPNQPTSTALNVSGELKESETTGSNHGLTIFFFLFLSLGIAFLMRASRTRAYEHQ